MLRELGLVESKFFPVKSLQHIHNSSSLFWGKANTLTRVGGVCPPCGIKFAANRICRNFNMARGLVVCVP